MKKSTRENMAKGLAIFVVVIMCVMMAVTFI